MTIVFNGRTVDTDARTLAAFLREQAIERNQVAAAIDGEFVARDKHAETWLEPGMRLEILAPVQGG